MNLNIDLFTFYNSRQTVGFEEFVTFGMSNQNRLLGLANFIRKTEKIGSKLVCDCKMRERERESKGKGVRKRRNKEKRRQNSFNYSQSCRLSIDLARKWGEEIN